MTAGMPDFGALLAQAQAMQQQVLQAQADLADVRVEGSSGGGLVTATVDGRGDLISLVITPEAFDPADPDALDTLGDLVVAAVRDARAAAEEHAGAQLSRATGGLADLGGSLGALFGGGPASADDEDESDDWDDEELEDEDLEDDDLTDEDLLAGDRDGTDDRFA